MRENSIEKTLTATLIECAKSYRKQDNPAKKEQLDDYARNEIEKNIPEPISRKDFWTDYTVYKRTNTR